MKIYFDQEYDDENLSIDISFISTMFYIKKVFNYRFKFMRLVSRLNSTREKLKVSYFDREYVQNNLVNIDISLSYLLFIDDFDVHKNMYRTLKVFYLISTNLTFHERRKIVNVFIFTLESHEAALKDVIDAIAKPIRQLNKNTTLSINDEDTKVCAFTFELINNMLQQTNNSEFLRHNVEKNCRSCFVSKKKKANLDFDVIIYDKYHFETIQQRTNAEQMTDKNRNNYLKKTNFQLKASMIVRLCSSLNLIRSRAYDISHSK